MVNNGCQAVPFDATILVMAEENLVFEKLKSFLRYEGPMFDLHTWIITWIDEWGISRGGFLLAMYVGFFVAASYMMPFYIPLVAGWILGTIPIWGPFAAIYAFGHAWIWFVRANFIYTRTNPVLLEVRVPKEVSRSPRAMEQVLSNLWIRMSETTFIDRVWFGGVRPYFSLEVASLGGDVRFYIWTRRGAKNIIEANMYAQYPEVEIVEAEDYASKFVYDPKVHECFVTDYRLEGVVASDQYMRISAYPIRSYVDFELDKDPKEELKVDPLAQMTEILSSAKSNEQVWIQIIFRSHLKSDWKNAVLKEIELIRQAALRPPGKSDEDIKSGKAKEAQFPHPTPVQQEQMKIMTRHLGKLPFEVGFRSIYIGPRGKMDGHLYTAMRWIYRPFANPNYAVQIRPRRAHNVFDYPWQDFGGWRWEVHTRRWLDAYRRRQWFHAPMIVPYNVFSVESLATIWHPPSRAIQSPGIMRLPSKKAEPPPNLPR